MHPPLSNQTSQEYFEKYLNSLTEKERKENELYIALSVDKDGKVYKSITFLFDEATSILNINFKSIIELSDFHFRDKQCGALDSLFGLLRSVLALHKEGFTNIKLLKRRKVPTPDIQAVYKGQDWFIEIKTVLSNTEWGSRKLREFDAYELSESLLEQRIIGCLQKKMLQFNSESQESKKLVLIVLNDSVANALYSNEDLKNIVLNAVNQLEIGARGACLLKDGTLLI